MVVCRMKKPQERQRKILIIDAKSEVTRERAQSFLTQAHLERIVSVYRAFEDQEGFCCVVDVEEIEANHASLNIALYVRRTNGTSEEGFTLAEAIDNWESSSVTLRAAMDDLFSALI